MRRRQGIVLAGQTEHKKTIVLLDKEFGKMVCVPDRPSVSHGMLFSYFVRTEGKMQFLYATELIAHMDSLARQDILFFQHIMEISCYFLPAACPAQPVFDLFLFLCDVKNLVDRKKRLFLCKFFVVLGLYPDGTEDWIAAIYSFALSPIDRIMSGDVDLDVKDAKLNEWLLRCVLVHPYSSHFRTTHFLTSDRSI